MVGWEVQKESDGRRRTGMGMGGWEKGEQRSLKQNKVRAGDGLLSFPPLPSLHFNRGLSSTQDNNHADPAHFLAACQEPSADAMPALVCCGDDKPRPTFRIASYLAKPTLTSTISARPIVPSTTQWIIYSQITPMHQHETPSSSTHSTSIR